MIRPTATRMLLLAAAARGHLYQEAGKIWQQPTERRVTNAVDVMVMAGWLAAGSTIRPGKVLVVPTPAGRMVLSSHGCCGRCGVEHSTHGQPARAQCQHTMADRAAPCPLDACPVWDVCPTCWGGA